MEEGIEVDSLSGWFNVKYLFDLVMICLFVYLFLIYLMFGLVYILWYNVFGGWNIICIFIYNI